MLDFIRVACAVPNVQVGNVEQNVGQICRFIAEADGQKVDVLTFPELSVTGYSCADLFFQDRMQEAERQGLQQIIRCSADHPGVTAVVGVTATILGQLYNCGAVIRAGRLQGLVPKTFLPNYNEFYENRWFSSAADLPVERLCVRELGLEGDYSVEVGRDLIFHIGEGARLGVEVCEDLWTPLPPSTLLSMNGAEVIVNLSASNETVGKRSLRRRLVEQQSFVCNCIYAYASSGWTESTQDLVFSGHSIIAAGGKVLAENQHVVDSGYMLVQDADLGLIRAERKHNKSVRDCASVYGGFSKARYVQCAPALLRSDGSLLKLNPYPFIPQDIRERKLRCLDIFQIQVAGLKRRLQAIGCNAVIGISGGLDSTLALLVCVEAMRQLGRPASDVYGVTMPCFGTSDRTYRNALELMEKLGVSSKEINIRSAVMGHFADIGHDPAVMNATYENSQARERTQILMDYASVVGGIVVGTGDLSELALGWCTYNGDHMSMYGVNGSVPKTLIPCIIEAVAEQPGFCQTREVLMDVVDTPISPELLPPDARGEISQQTEDIVGPYALHDFYLYYAVRYGFSPAKIYDLAQRAFKGQFTPEIIKKWLVSFYRRFFTQQFKRNCLPDGPKVGSVSLSSRGDWRMPSDASYRTWIEEAEKL